MRVFLYGRSDCHLCEVAKHEFQPLVEAGLLELDYRDIDTNSDWLNAYSRRIPVAQTEAGVEYDWPFRAAEIITNNTE